MTSPYSLAIQFRDLDAFGHVGHPDVIAFCQEPRLAMFREMSRHTGRDLGAESGFVVVKIEAEYRRPILYSDQEVQIRDEIIRIGNSSFGVRHRVEVANETAALVHATLVLVTEDGKPRPLSALEREWLQDRLVPAETE